MVAKIQALDKTLVTEFAVQIADINLRQKFMKGAISAKIVQTANLVQADATVTDTQHVTITNVISAIIINSFSPILLDLTNDSGTILNVPCNGLFINYGQFTSVVIKGTDSIGTRLSYTYS
jgi:hypothetical protein